MVLVQLGLAEQWLGPTQCLLGQQIKEVSLTSTQPPLTSIFLERVVSDPPDVSLPTIQFRMHSGFLCAAL